MLPDDAVLVSGITNMGYWAHFAYRSRQPRTYLTSSYFATLGFSFPVALGAKVALPERPVVSITGDGGFMYALPELATAVHYDIGVVVVVFVDNALGASKNDQRTRFKGREIGTTLHNPSFAEVARVFGAQGVRTAPERLDSGLARGPRIREADSDRSPCAHLGSAIPDPTAHTLRTTMTKPIICCVIFVTLLSYAITTVAEDRPVQRTVTEKRLVQIDFASLIPELFAVSPDSQHVAYGVRAEQKQVVIVDGKEGKAYQAIVSGMLRFSPDSKRLAYGVQQDRQSFLVVDDKASNPMRRSGLAPCALARIASASPTRW